MSIKVGIPRALLYYEFFPFWKKFFEELGAEVIVSSPTNKKILDLGVHYCVDEACVPVKLFHGHVMDLKDKVDYLFVPRLTSVAKGEFICPKFGGLPDMIIHSLPQLPPVLMPEINLRRRKKDVWNPVYEIGSILTPDSDKIRRAYMKAEREYKAFREKLRKGNLNIDVLPERAGLNDDEGNAEGRTADEKKASERDTDVAAVTTNKVNKVNSGDQICTRPVEKRYGNHKFTVIKGSGGSTGGVQRKGGHGEIHEGLTIALLGHVYNLYDDYLTMNLLSRLRQRKINVITAEMIDDDQIDRELADIPKKMFWTYGKRLLGAGRILAKSDQPLDGIIYVMSFGCGIDAFIEDQVKRAVRNSGDIPYMTLTIDEHTGEAGISTRIEAFLDMIEMRRGRLAKGGM